MLCIIMVEDLAVLTNPIKCHTIQAAVEIITTLILQ